MNQQSRPIATVFGGTGFIGHAVVQELASAGYQVRVPTRDLDKALTLKPLGQAGQIILIYSNKPSDAGLALLMQGAEIVINLIGSFRDMKQAGMLTLHVELPARMARMAKTAGVTNFIHISTQGANEQAENTYETSKSMGERSVRTFFPDAVILRPNLTYGPRDQSLNRWATMARFLPILPLWGRGRYKTQPIFVGDVAKAVLACTKSAETRGKTYELNGSKSLSQKEILQILLDVTGQDKLLCPVPWSALKFSAYLPFSPLTRDLIKSWQKDHIASSTTPQITDLGITPQDMGDALEGYVG